VTTPLPPLPDDVPPPVRELVTAMLAKDPAERPASAAAVARRMRELGAADVPSPTPDVDRSSVDAAPPPPPRRWRRPTWAELAADRLWLTVVGAGLALAAVLALTLGTLALGGDQPSGSSPETRADRLTVRNH